MATPLYRARYQASAGCVGATGSDGSDVQRSLETFQLSPEEFFAGADRAFAELRASLGSVVARTDALADLCAEMARTRLPLQASPPATRWSYDARLPNLVFADVFEPEALPDGGFKRWVNASGRLATRLRLPRHVQYDLVVQIEEFCSEAAAQSFYLRIDGVQYPWLSHASRRYTSLILEDLDAETLDLEIGVAPEAMGGGGETTFSFRSIDLVRRC
jgi:hypothetical protein